MMEFPRQLLFQYIKYFRQINEVANSFLPSCPLITPAFLASSSAVAKPFTIFCLTTGGGVGGREAGGVGGLLRLFCCTEMYKMRKKKKHLAHSVHLKVKKNVHYIFDRSSRPYR